MKPTSPTRRASPLARLVFIPILHGSLSGGLALARYLDVSYSFLCYGLKCVMNNALVPKCLAILLGLALFVVEDFQLS